MKKIIMIVFLVSMIASTCYAESGFFGAAPEGTPSIINYGWEGLTLGALLGLSAGYLSYAHSNETKDIGMSTAYGALIGTGAGLVLGFSDASKGKKGYGAIVLRDMHLGGNLGLAVGGIIGAVQYSSDKEWKRVTKGLSWGYIAGAVAGLGIGLYEGPILSGEKSPETSSKHVVHGLALFADSHDQICPGYQVAYRF